MGTLVDKAQTKYRQFSPARAICSNMKCKAAVLDKSSTVCHACGSTLVRECPRCGADLPSDVPEIRYCVACGVLLSVDIAEDSIERRTHERFPSSIDGLVEEVQNQTKTTNLPAHSTCRVTDIGIGGCYVSTESPYPKHTRVRLILTDDRRVFDGEAVVIHSTAGVGMGLAFVDVSDDQTISLTDWLKDLKGTPDVTIERAERRGHLRVAVRIGVELVERKSGMRLHGEVTNLSVEGCYVATPSPCRQGVRVMLNLIKDGQRFESLAIVARTIPGQGMGLAFTDTAPNQEVVLVDWLREAVKDNAHALA